MKVLKFGGSSVANASNIKKVGAIVLKHAADKQLVVVSALGGVTDQLIAIGQMAARGNEEYKATLETIEKRHLDTARELLPVTSQSSSLSMIKQYCNELEDICEGVFRLQELSARTKDRIISFGELLSSKIIAAYLQSLNAAVEWVDARQMVKTNSNFGYAAVDFELTNTKIYSALEHSAAKVFLVPGFIASNQEGQTTTLGRGGSDYTAAIFSAALHALVLEIWTDVSGMMTADPRWVTNARPIPHISYQEAMELSHFGAKVIYPPTIQPVMSKKIPTWVKNTFAPEDYGTLIQSGYANGNDKIRGISSISHVALLSLEGSGMVGIPGFSKRLFEALASQHVNVILITQSSSEHSICVAINAADLDVAKQTVDKTFEIEISTGKVEPLSVETDLSIIAVVGDKMKSHPGISGSMFGALGRNGINIRAIAQGSSERNISAVISTSDAKKAVNVLHEIFFEAVYKQLNVFIAGLGNVGSKLLSQLAQQQQYLLDHLKLQLRITGIANSRKMLFADEGLNLSNWKEQLEGAETSNLSEFVNSIISRNLRNSLFVDVTANPDVAKVYDQLLVKSISVVACNKIAASSPFENYQKLKSLSAEYNAPFLFETNVGAGLPIIGTLNDLVKSGDQVNRIEAVLSGTLNFVFNNYDGSKSFSSVVRQAQTEGYTEPDPRLDLGGTDVMRKIMILAREAGNRIEMEDIANNGFLPASCFEGTVEDFYNEMEKHEEHFKALYDAAAAQNCKLKFVASYNEGKAAVGLQHIAPEHDLYHLYGKDNIVLFYTDRYPEQPLVIKGAGAGADVTASGVFADIIRVTTAH
jgi:aspartokinase/homoserine dehydrogenase 1